MFPTLFTLDRHIKAPNYGPYQGKIYFTIMNTDPQHLTKFHEFLKDAKIPNGTEEGIAQSGFAHYGPGDCVIGRDLRKGNREETDELLSWITPVECFDKKDVADLWAVRDDILGPDELRTPSKAVFQDGIWSGGVAWEHDPLACCVQNASRCYTAAFSHQVPKMLTSPTGGVKTNGGILTPHHLLRKRLIDVTARIGVRAMTLSAPAEAMLLRQRAEALNFPHIGNSDNYYFSTMQLPPSTHWPIYNNVRADVTPTSIAADGHVLTSADALMNYLGRALAQLAHKVMGEVCSDFQVSIDTTQFLQSISYVDPAAVTALSSPGPPKRLQLKPWDLAPQSAVCSEVFGCTRQDVVRLWNDAYRRKLPFFPESSDSGLWAKYNVFSDQPLDVNENGLAVAMQKGKSRAHPAPVNAGKKSKKRGRANSDLVNVNNIGQVQTIRSITFNNPTPLLHGPPALPPPTTPCCHSKRARAQNPGSSPEQPLREYINNRRHLAALHGGGGDGGGSVADNKLDTDGSENDRDPDFYPTTASRPHLQLKKTKGPTLLSSRRLAKLLAPLDARSTCEEDSEEDMDIDGSNNSDGQEETDPPYQGLQAMSLAATEIDSTQPYAMFIKKLSIFALERFRATINRSIYPEKAKEQTAWLKSLLKDVQAQLLLPRERRQPLQSSKYLVLQENKEYTIKYNNHLPLQRNGSSMHDLLVKFTREALLLWLKARHFHNPDVLLLPGMHDVFCRVRGSLLPASAVCGSRLGLNSLDDFSKYHSTQPLATPKSPEGSDHFMEALQAAADKLAWLEMFKSKEPGWCMPYIEAYRFTQRVQWGRKILPQLGPLTGMLIAANLVYTGKVIMPSAEEMGEMVYLLDRGASACLRFFRLLDRSSDKESVIFVFTSLYNKVYSSFTEAERSTMTFDPIMFEHSLCKYQCCVES
ncbi:hypothetical protein C8Q79DRAFT_1011390 [Trametes meyenii]|nr:hypothetical protein C8Q79DRAFT_1011390 [Trametes meyenii]